jgi:hypothetical protein
MPSSGMLCRMALVRTDVSEECSASSIRPTRIGEIGTMLALKNGVFWDVTPRGSCKNLVFLRSVLRLLVAVSVVPMSD